MLALPVSEEPIIGFEDDLAVLIIVEHPEDVEVYAMEIVKAVNS